MIMAVVKNNNNIWLLVANGKQTVAVLKSHPSTPTSASMTINVTTTEHGGIYCTYMRLCDIPIKIEEGRLRGRDEEIEEAKVQTVTFGSPCNSPDEIHYHPQQINKE